jgi:hypothetical protein
LLRKLAAEGGPPGASWAAAQKHGAEPFVLLIDWSPDSGGHRAARWRHGRPGWRNVVSGLEPGRPEDRMTAGRHPVTS